MSLVLLIHYIPTRGTPTPDSLKSEFWETILNLELKSLAFVCVNCFVLISGFFGIKWKTRSYSHLLWLVVFWGAVSYLVNLAVTKTEVLPGGLFGNDHISYLFFRWFIGAYLCLYLLAPVINSFIDNSSQQTLGRFIIYFYVFSTVFGWFMKSPNFNEGMSELSLVGLYFVGAYLRKTDIKIFSYKGSIDLYIYFGLGFVLVIVSAIALYLGVAKSLYGYLNPIVILQSIYLFLFFKKLKLRHIGWVNFIAASTFSVYLFHTHAYLENTYKAVGQWANTHGTLLSLLIIVLVFAGIFLFCSVVDLFGNKLFNTFYNLLTFRKKSVKE